MMATGAVMPVKMKAKTVPVVITASCTRVWLPGRVVVKHRPQYGTCPAGGSTQPCSLRRTGSLWETG
jgi:hypothetical protein